MLHLTSPLSPLFSFFPLYLSCPPLSLLLSAIGKVSFAYWGSALAFAIVAELVAVQRRKSSDAGRLQNGPDGYRAGDLGLDPFSLADDEVSDWFGCRVFFVSLEVKEQASALFGGTTGGSYYLETPPSDLSKYF